LQFLLSAGVPLLASNPQENLPACCRRDGKHHCTGHIVAGVHDGNAVRVVNAKCPVFPKAAVTSCHTQEAAPGTSQAFYAAVVAHPAIHVQTESSYRICWSRSQQKRGPPALV
jgi:hypothetical protein